MSKRDDRICWIGACAAWVLIAVVGCDRNPSPSDATAERPEPSSVANAHTGLDSAVVSVVGITPRAASESLADQIAKKVDAEIDDWNTEVLNDVIGGQLKKLAKLIEHPADIEATSVSQIVAEEFRCVPLRPDDLAQVFDDQFVSVRRWRPVESEFEFDGTAGLVAALQSLVASFREQETVYVKFKQFKIEKTESSIETRVYYEANHRDKQSSGQQTATWVCRWTVPTMQNRTGGTASAPGKPRIPRLKSIKVVDYEEASLVAEQGGGSNLFADCTESILGANASYREQVLPSINHWLSRIGREFMGQFGQHGLAIGDVNGDGLDDLYVCDAGGLPNRLYLHQPDGTAIDASSESGVDLLEDSVGALLIDLDNDGDQDLVVATDPWLQFAENDGKGHFTLRRGYSAYSDIYSLCAADYDNDGDLDLYACGYNARRQDPVHRGLPFPLPYHDAENGGGNVLLQNDGNFVFHDATEKAGLDVNNSRFSLAASWEDFDNDGDQDLYVANDFGRNCLYRNDDGRFTDVAAEAAVEDHASGMSVSWGDYNRDGWMDVYVSNMFSAAGNRVTYQRKFSDGLTERTTANVQRMARGNTLFANGGGNGSSVFQDVSEAAAVTMGRWAWASRFVDLNNDGWQDLVVANGYVTNEDTSDL